jgi:hypothetical protein
MGVMSDNALAVFKPTNIGVTGAIAMAAAASTIAVLLVAVCNITLKFGNLSFFITPPY